MYSWITKTTQLKKDSVANIRGLCELLGQSLGECSSNSLNTVTLTVDSLLTEHLELLHSEKKSLNAQNHSSIFHHGIGRML